MPVFYLMIGQTNFKIILVIKLPSDWSHGNKSAVGRGLQHLLFLSQPFKVFYARNSKKYFHVRISTKINGRNNSRFISIFLCITQSQTLFGPIFKVFHARESKNFFFMCESWQNLTAENNSRFISIFRLIGFAKTDGFVIGSGIYDFMSGFNFLGPMSLWSVSETDDSGVGTF
jgi:hypothetical protein